MRNGYPEEVIVHPVGGMQLSEGSIYASGDQRFVGKLPGLTPSVGDTVEEVLKRMNRKARAYYGDDVVVELASEIVAG